MIFRPLATLCTILFTLLRFVSIVSSFAPWTFYSRDPSSIHFYTMLFRSKRSRLISTARRIGKACGEDVELIALDHQKLSDRELVDTHYRTAYINPQARLGKIMDAHRISRADPMLFESTYYEAAAYVIRRRLYVRWSPRRRLTHVGARAGQAGRDRSSTGHGTQLCRRRDLSKELCRAQRRHRARRTGRRALAATLLPRSLYRRPMMLKCTHSLLARTRAVYSALNPYDERILSWPRKAAFSAAVLNRP